MYESLHVAVKMYINYSFLHLCDLTMMNNNHHYHHCFDEVTAAP